MIQPPNTDIGRLQQEIRTLQNQIRIKVDDNKFYEICRRLDRTECLCGTLSSEITSLQHRISALEESLSGRN